MNMLPSNGSFTPENNPIMSPSTRERVRVFFLFLATALISLFFCCFHSPFYRFSIYPDANAYMGVARAIGHGLMPYRDVFDHKGILLYLINYGAGSLFPKSMTGVYLSISLSLTIFLWYGYRIARMFLSTIPSLIATLSLLFTNSTMDVTGQIARINPSYRLICTRLSDNDVKYSYRVYAKDRTGGEP